MIPMTMIESGEASSTSNASALKQGLGSYCDFKLDTLQLTIPVSGSSTHDSTIGDGIGEALDAWRDLIEADADSIVLIYDALSAADDAIAAQMSER